MPGDIVGELGNLLGPISTAIITTFVSIVIFRVIKHSERKKESRDDEMKDEARRQTDVIKETAQQVMKEMVLKNQVQQKDKNYNPKSFVESLEMPHFLEQIKKDNDVRDSKLIQMIKNNSERISENQRLIAERIAAEFRGATAEIAQELENRTDQRSKDILDKIEEINDRLSAMIKGLQTGAAHTDSNVNIVRNEITSLQEDIDDIYDKMNYKELIKDPIQRQERNRKKRNRKLASIADFISGAPVGEENGLSSNNNDPETTTSPSSP
jgi:hypothetical protein